VDAETTLWRSKEGNMRRDLLHFGMTAVAAGWLCSPAVAGDTHFKIEPITIPGGTGVEAVAINNKGVIVGGYNGSEGVLPFILSGTTVTTLPPPVSPCPNNFCQAIATAINDAGDVVGETSDPGYPQGFLWHDGAYVPEGAFRMGYGANILGLGLSNKGKEFFNYIESNRAITPYAGRPASIRPITAPGPGLYTYLYGINNHGVLAGQFAVTSTTGAVFFGKGGKYTTLLPPNAVSAYDGFINDSGEVSGGYVDSAGANHGFVYSGGTYKVFDFPAGVKGPFVGPINNSGRVVGYYQDPTTNKVVLFLYNGAVVSEVASLTNVITIAINDHGVVVFSDYTVNGSQSYRVRCAGSGC
jgi:probable HAF family extracellular repeat protein